MKSIIHGAWQTGLQYRGLTRGMAALANRSVISPQHSSNKVHDSFAGSFFEPENPKI
jgi:hypothetical protein